MLLAAGMLLTASCIFMTLSLRSSFACQELSLSTDCSDGNTLPTLQVFHQSDVGEYLRSEDDL